MAVQAIAGVSATKESIVWVEYPSIAAGGIGQVLGSLYECLPIKIFGIGPSLSHVFALATAPVGAMLYGFQKVFGNRYILTNRGVQIWSSRGNRMVSSIGFRDFERIELTQNPGQVFFKAHDIRFIGSAGETLMKLSGVKDAGAFKNAIERTVESRIQVEAAEATIAARG